MTPPLATVVERPGDHGLSWTDSRHGHARIFTLAGRLDREGAARLRAHIHALLQERAGRGTVVIIDLRQIYDIAEGALDILIADEETPGIDLRLVAAPHPALASVETCHRGNPPPLFHTPEAALTPELPEVQRLRLELEQRRQQLAGQPTIEQAKGILMHNFGLTSDEAFALIRRLSQDTNLKVRKVAEELVGSLTGHVTPQAARRVADVIEGLRKQARAAQ